MCTLLDQTKFEIGFNMPLVEKILITEYETTYVPPKKKVVVMEDIILNNVSIGDDDTPIAQFLDKKKKS